MTASTSPDFAAQWNSARRLYPIYSELAREFALDLKPCGELESGVESPGKEAVEQANHWLEQMDNSVQVHQLRQFLQTNTQVNSAGLIALMQHFLAKPEKTDAIRDKIDFLLVQYFSQIAPTGVDDSEVDLAYVAQAMQPIVNQVDLKPPVWLNALDRVLESARRCKSLDELLHGGILEQGRKAKGQAGELFYLPIALVAFTRFGYLMRRTFFRLMLGDLNLILDGLTELEGKGVKTIDCRRAQFSAQEPIVRLRVICQSWKVMFQAEYSSGSPLRMLVDLRASVEHALGRGKTAPPAAKAKPAPAGAAAKPAAPAKTPVASKPAPQRVTIGKPAPGLAAKATAAAAAAGGAKPATRPPVPPPAPRLKKPVPAAAPEFEVSSTPGWEDDPPSPVKKK